MKLLIITETKSDLSDLMERCFSDYIRLTPAQALHLQEDCCDAVAILGGGNLEPLHFYPPLRNKLSQWADAGKRIFSEYTVGIGDVELDHNPVSTRFSRPVVVDPSGPASGLAVGTILDEQRNDRLICFRRKATQKPLLQYVDKPVGFYRVENPDKIQPEVSKLALWLETPDLMFCTFRMCNFAKASFAPRGQWSKLIREIIVWLGGSCSEEQVMDMFRGVVRMRGDEAVELDQVIDDAIAWFANADMFIDCGDGPYAAKEGPSAEVLADGTHLVRDNPRPDETGKTARTMWLYGHMRKNARFRELADQLMRFPLDMQIRDRGPFHGMVRWAVLSYHALYADDVAQGFLMPLLWKAYLTDDRSGLPFVRDALDFLLRVTGSDGLTACAVRICPSSVDRVNLMGVKEDPVSGKWSWCSAGEQVPMEEIPRKPLDCASAHYNGYYLACLMFYGKLTGETLYVDAGRKGMRSLMSHYPNTAREHSETQELCRLLIPLAMLYWVSEDPEEKQWLYRVTEDLDRLRHHNGGFMEWDTGYQACCAGVQDGEASVLACNGDPVADLLYSSNWLTESFALAFHVTGDPLFRENWQYAVDFFRKFQLCSSNPLLHGAWARSVDLENEEVYGVPNDVAWAPWTMETGWTVAQIVFGMLLGQLWGMDQDA